MNINLISAVQALGIINRRERRSDKQCCSSNTGHYITSIHNVIYGCRSILFVLSHCLVCTISNHLALAEIFHSDVKQEDVFPFLAFVTSVLPSIEDKMVCRVQKKGFDSNGTDAEYSFEGLERGY